MLRITEPGRVVHIPETAPHTESVPSASQANQSFARLTAHLTFAHADLLADDIDIVRRALCIPNC